MKLLLDTHGLIWAAGFPERISKQASDLMNDHENELVFSAASLWEVAIKSPMGRPDFDIDPRVLRRGLLDVLLLMSLIPIAGLLAKAQMSGTIPTFPLI